MVKTMTVAEYLDAALDISGKTQREIGLEVGYTKPNFLSMMKTGVTKVPIDKIPLLARACGVDEKKFLRIALNEYLPATWSVIQESLNTDLLTEDEEQLLKEYRAVKDSIPPNAYDSEDFDPVVILQAIEKGRNQGNGV